MLALLLASSTTSVADGGVCTLSEGDVLINKVLPAPSSGSEWVELYNTTGSTVGIN